MSQQIGMDPVELDGLVQQFINENRASFEALMPEAQTEFRKALKEQIETWTRLLEEERRKTLDHVLRIMDVLDRLEKSPLLRSAIIKFRDDV